MRSWFPDLGCPRASLRHLAECATHHDAIKEALATNHLSTVHQRLRDEHGFTASESSLRRYVTIALAGEAKADRVTVLKDDPPPGEEARWTTADSGCGSTPGRDAGVPSGRS